VLIAGAGVAASAAAIQLLDYGIPVVVMCTRTSTVPGIEMIPDSTLAACRVFNLEHKLRCAGAVSVSGFEMAWGSGGRVVRQGRVIHVDRSALADTMMAEARRRGAQVIEVSHLPSLAGADVRVDWGTGHRSFLATVDATGRSAVWSRPIQRAGRRIADLFRIDEPARSPRRARVAEIDSGWAYRIGLTRTTTVGVIRDIGSRVRRLETAVAEVLEVSPSAATYVGRRPAFPQWATVAISERRLAVGDAVLAHDPISGRGISFAIVSALAAATVIRTWIDFPENAAWATEYYNGLIDFELRRHLRFVEAFYSEGPQLRAERTRDFGDLLEGDAWLRFAGTVRTVGLRIQDRIVPGEALLLAGGATVRWLGNVDALALRRVSGSGLRVAEAIDRLRENCIPRNEAVALLSWGLEHGVLIRVPARDQVTVRQ
jgi:hypothetical protein